MSTILKALKRLEEEKQRGKEKTPLRADLSSVVPDSIPAPEKPTRPAPALLLALLLVTAGGAGLWALNATLDPPQETPIARLATSDSVPPPPAVIAPPEAPPVAARPPKQPAPAETAGAEPPPKPVVEPRSVAEPKPVVEPKPLALAPVPDPPTTPPVAAPASVPKLAAKAAPKPIETAVPPEPTPATNPLSAPPASKPPEVAALPKPTPAKPEVPKAKPRPATPGAAASMPWVRVRKTIWHPSPDRRRVHLETRGRKGIVTLREGDAIGTLVVLRVEPSAVVFLHGNREVRRKVGAK